MPGFGAFLITLALAPGLRVPDLPMPPMTDLVSGPPPAQMDAQAWMLYSLDERADVWSRNPDTPRAPASITKVMTALLVVERGDLGAVVTISPEADRTAIGFPGQPEVFAGEEWSVLDLFDFLLVKSGNDVAAALAEHVAGTEAEFVVLMNERAAELGMGSTTFRNPHGLDESGHLSTPRDLIRLGEAAIEHPIILETTRIRALTFRPAGRDEMFVDNTNKLIGSFPGVYGIKTGDTLAAGRVLLSYLDAGGRRYLGVVMGSVDHIAASRELLAYALRTLGPSDYFLAPIAGSDAAEALPDWMLPRIAAAGDLADGRQSVTPRYETPASRDIIASFRDLLPALLGGEP